MGEKRHFQIVLGRRVCRGFYFLDQIVKLSALDTYEVLPAGSQRVHPDELSFDITELGNEVFRQSINRACRHLRDLRGQRFTSSLGLLVRIDSGSIQILEAPDADWQDERLLGWLRARRHP